MVTLRRVYFERATAHDLSAHDAATGKMLTSYELPSGKLPPRSWFARQCRIMGWAEVGKRR